MTNKEMLEKIIAMLESLMPEKEPEVCDHTKQDFVSRDGWFHCEHCNMRLEKSR